MSKLYTCWRCKNSKWIKEEDLVERHEDVKHWDYVCPTCESVIICSDRKIKIKKELNLPEKGSDALMVCPKCNFRIYANELKNFKSCGQCGSKAIYKILKTKSQSGVTVAQKPHKLQVGKFDSSLCDMNVGKLKEIIKDLPDNMTIGRTGHFGEWYSCKSSEFYVNTTLNGKKFFQTAIIDVGDEPE